MIASALIYYVPPATWPRGTLVWAAAGKSIAEAA